MTEKETEQLHSLPIVESVDVHEFSRLMRKYPETQSIVMQTWESIDPEGITFNTGAGPCVIIWEFDRRQGKMKRSGHFPEVSQERTDKFFKQELDYLTKKFHDPITDNFENAEAQKVALPSEVQVNRFGFPDKKKEKDGFEQFTLLGKIISSEVKEGETEKDIFLFGQNGVVFKEEPTRSESIVDNALDHFDLTVEIRKWGIPETRVHDIRSSDNDGVDYTLYVASENKIYHHHKMKNDPYP